MINTLGDFDLDVNIATDLHARWAVTADRASAPGAKALAYA